LLAKKQIHPTNEKHGEREWSIRRVGEGNVKRQEGRADIERTKQTGMLFQAIPEC
jgi:hypothetical protein